MSSVILSRPTGAEGGEYNHKVSMVSIRDPHCHTTTSILWAEIRDEDARCSTRERPYIYGSQVVDHLF